nr:RNA-directed DNA polymerase, eukaryota [Tanacetum cinerariifolium]
MSRIQSWNETIETMACRLSKWKLKTLSIGGRLTLLKSVLGSMPIYHMSLFKVSKKVLHRMESMLSHFFNGAELSSKKSVLVKWKHALASKDNGGLGSSLWARVIKALQGYDGKIGQKVKSCYPSWYWALEGSGEFTITSVRKMTDDFMLPKVSSKTRWFKAIPIKVNVHAWKVKLDRLPTRLNISRRGIDIESILFPMCGKEVESTSHIFLTCQMSKEISSYEEWLDWILNMRLSVNSKQLFEGVCYVLWWHVWSFRNKTIFGSQIHSKAMIFDDVMSHDEDKEADAIWEENDKWMDSRRKDIHEARLKDEIVRARLVRGIAIEWNRRESE